MEFSYYVSFQTKLFIFGSNSFIWEKNKNIYGNVIFPSKSLLAIGLLSNVIALGLVIAPSYMHNNECEVLEVKNKFILKPNLSFRKIPN